MDKFSYIKEQLQLALTEVATRCEEMRTQLEIDPSPLLVVLSIASSILFVCLFIIFRSIQSYRATIKRQEAEIERLSERLKSQEGLALPAQIDELATLPTEIAVEEVEKLGEQEEPTVTQVVAAPRESAISRGLEKSRTSFLSKLSGFFSGRSRVATADLDSLEELLIVSDVGARCALELVSQVRVLAEEQGSLAPSELIGILQEGIVNTLIPVAEEHPIYKPNRSPLVILVVGVNGVGKTTTVAKLATRYMREGKKVLAIAADTFRAAAVEQLAEWSNRVGFALTRGAEGAKPSAVVFDGMVAATQGNYDVVLIDTAGRLHTKSNLMQELEGVRNVIRKHVPDGPHETVLVVDGVSGQNALSQAREFNAAVPLTGIVITKLDGTPKGGIVVAISQELKLPVFFIGVGEKVEDLVTFDRSAFVEALFSADGRGYQDSSGLTGKSVGNS